MIKSPSVQSNNKSLHNIENYKKEFSGNIEEYTNSYSVLIKYFIQTICNSSEIRDFKQCEFLILRGTECLAHIYNILLLYTKNIELVNFHCNKASHYFIEFISQIGNDSHSFLQLNTKDAILFVYKKTIFDINQEYRNNYKYKENDEFIINNVKKYTESVNKYIYIILQSYKNMSNNELFEQQKFFKHTTIKMDLIFNKTYYNNLSLEKNTTFQSNVVSIIEFFVSKDYNSDCFIYIETFIKKLYKSNYNNKKINSKIQHPEFDENKNTLSVNKLVKWVLD